MFPTGNTTTSRFRDTLVTYAPRLRDTAPASSGGTSPVLPALPSAGTPGPSWTQNSRSPEDRRPARDQAPRPAWRPSRAVPAELLAARMLQLRPAQAEVRGPALLTAVLSRSQPVVFPAAMFGGSQGCGRPRRRVPLRDCRSARHPRRRLVSPPPQRRLVAFTDGHSGVAPGAFRCGTSLGSRWGMSPAMSVLPMHGRPHGEACTRRANAPAAVPVAIRDRRPHPGLSPASTRDARGPRPGTPDPPLEASAPTLERRVAHHRRAHPPPPGRRTRAHPGRSPAIPADSHARRLEPGTRVGNRGLRASQPWPAVRACVLRRRSRRRADPRPAPRLRPRGRAASRAA
jgi:hypothetical protein